MLRIRANPTRDQFLPRSPLTAAALVVHLLAITLLVRPLRQMVSSPLIDRTLVYLAPPNRIEATENEHGDIAAQVPSAIAAASPEAKPKAEPSPPVKRTGSGADFTGTTVVARTAPVLPPVGGSDL